MKQEQAQEMTQKIKRMGEENQVEDEWDTADKMTGLGFKINNKLFSQTPKQLIDPNKNFFKLEGKGPELPDPSDRVPKGRRMIKKQREGGGKTEAKKDGAKRAKIRFVKRDKRRGERKTKRSKGRRIC